ncbi:AMP-binding protein [Tahibacter harae]|uniref:AMP-binding protein n=1 Tax=Tahibacter harae TaxID=2963937 RepID=A0ABT1QR66_9GAMM|nr:AMP-binding protein [Tahibacter harae]MCQ4164769.1 AMP-binding protein [Tahibacter harae]
MKKPIWEPSPERIERANINRFVRYVREQTGNEDLRRYAPLYDFSIRHPERFWSLVWEFCGIRASGTFHEVLVDADRLPGARWFPGIRLNFAQNLLRFRDERCALSGPSLNSGTLELSYAELQQQVARLAAALREQGLKPGDHVSAVLPNCCEAVIALLAAVALGATWSACAGTADAAHIAAALGGFAPQWIFTGAAHEAAVAAAQPQARRIVIGAASAQAIAWNTLLAHEPAPLSYELAGFDHPLYALHHDDGSTSLHSAGGTLIQHLKELVLHADLKREDRVLFAADPGQPLWYWLVSALAVGSTLVLAGANFDPAQDASWDRVDEHAVSVIALTPAQIEAFCDGAANPRETHKLLSLKTVLAVGGQLDAGRVAQVYARLKDRLMLSTFCGHAGGLSFLALGCPLLPVYADEVQCRGLGMKIEILDETGQPLHHEQRGALACLAPFPALPLGLLGDTDGSLFQQRYFARRNAWCSGERGTLTEHEGVQLQG